MTLSNDNARKLMNFVLTRLICRGYVTIDDVSDEAVRLGIVKRKDGDNGDERDCGDGKNDTPFDN